jgi:hypothetical protein
MRHGNGRPCKGRQGAVAPGGPAAPARGHCGLVPARWPQHQRSPSPALAGRHCRASLQWGHRGTACQSAPPAWCRPRGLRHQERPGGAARSPDAWLRWQNQSGRWQQCASRLECGYSPIVLWSTLPGMACNRGNLCIIVVVLGMGAVLAMCAHSPAPRPVVGGLFCHLPPSSTRWGAQQARKHQPASTPQVVVSPLDRAL